MRMCTHGFNKGKKKKDGHVMCCDSPLEEVVAQFFFKKCAHVHACVNAVLQGSHVARARHCF